MVNQRSFGRVNAEHKDRRVGRAEPVPSYRPAFAEIPVEQYSPPAQPESRSLDDELREWKRARKQQSNFPWKLLSVTATLCFGFGSFALPDSVNDSVQWLLYALAAASFYAGFVRRRRKTEN